VTTPSEFVKEQMAKANRWPRFALISKAKADEGYHTWVGMTRVHRQYERVQDFGEQTLVVDPNVNTEPQGTETLGDGNVNR
jgi:hypothetical protein